MASSRFVAFLLTCASLALAQTSALTAPTVIFGLQPQRPPVARVNQTWSWSLLPNTFQTATSDSLTYTVDRLPEWAQFDPATLSFTGLPRRHDVANTTVYVTAQSTGDLGSVTDSFGLLVERGPGPTIRYPVAQQLPNATTLPEGRVLEYNGAVVVPPRWSFSIGLQWDTFALADGDFAYYTAYQEGYTSLPEWVTFDPASVTFDGVSPYNGSIDIVVYGSNHWGYGDVWQRFSIEVDRHTFDLTRELPPLNTSLGANVDYEITLANLVIDQAPAAPADITVSPDLSSLPFLSYNPSNRQISGRVPTAASSVNSTIIPVTFNNTLGNSLVANLTFSVVGAVAAEGLLTTSVIPALLVAPGQSFTSNLAQYATEADATYSASFMPTAAGQWLSFNASSLLLAGTAPSPAPTYGNVTVTLSARERSSGAMQNATLPIAFSALTTNLNSNEGDEGGLSKTGKIALAAVFGGLGGLALLILLSICCRRRRAAQRQEEEVDDRRVLTQDVSPYIGGYNEEKEGRSWGGTPNLDVEAPAAKAKRMDLMRVFNKVRPLVTAVQLRCTHLRTGRQVSVADDRSRYRFACARQWPRRRRHRCRTGSDVSTGQRSRQHHARRFELGKQEYEVDVLLRQRAGHLSLCPSSAPRLHDQPSSFRTTTSSPGSDLTLSYPSRLWRNLSHDQLSFPRLSVHQRYEALLFRSTERRDDRYGEPT